MLRLSELARMVDGRLHGVDCVFDGVSTDTRTLRQGELFVALHGPNFDGHDYLDIAQARGAAGALVGREAPGDLSSVIVDDTLRGLGQLGRGWRERCRARLIAITGSNGKTTLKEMIAAILHAAAKAEARSRPEKSRSPSIFRKPPTAARRATSPSCLNPNSTANAPPGERMRGTAAKSAR